jgi:RHS repeat-associated protein
MVDQNQSQSRLYYYGARYYDSKWGIWLGVDKKADKYPMLSPFSYCANNPLKFIDPNGREIWLSYTYKSDGKTTSVQFKNGSLFNIDGSEYKGGNPYFERVATQLNQLQSVNTETKNIVTTLESSENKHTITNIDQAYPDDPGNSNRSINILDDGIITGIEESGGTITKYDPDKEKTINGNKRSPKVGLIHELKHAFDRDQGKLRKGTTKNGIPFSEVDAVNVENQVRQVTGDDKRTSYGGVKIPTEDLK